MKRLLLLTVIGSVVFCSATTAQKVNTDSLKWVSRISEDQLKLGKLQNTVDQKTTNKQNNAILAQTAADQNTQAANKLSSNPENKQDARQADNAASDARSDAKKARKSADKLNDVNSEIAKLQAKIAKEQIELNKYIPVQTQPQMVAPVAVADTTHQN